MSEPRSIAATLAALLGAVAFALAVAGPIVVHLGIASPFVGFRIFALGVVSGVVPIVLGVIALVRTRGGARRGRAHAWLGTSLGVLLVAVFVFLTLPVRDLPRINDITTNPEDPPGFERVVRLAPNRDRDLRYPGESFAVQQRSAYPDLETIRLEASPDEAFASAVAAADALGWNVLASDPEQRRFEATQTSRIFRFADDIVVRVRPAPDGVALVDVRSKSRDGIGDLGANAARIRAFRDALTR